MFFSLNCICHIYCYLSAPVPGVIFSGIYTTNQTPVHVADLVRHCNLTCFRLVSFSIGCLATARPHS